MKWQPFLYDGETYNLEHLHPVQLEIVQPAKDKKPEKKYLFNVQFSLHCFTKTQLEGDDAALAYSDNRETRTFCFDRYHLSKYLPDIINNIGQKRCNHTGYGNFFIVEVIDDNGNSIEYEIYFDVTKPDEGKKRPMVLYIQSAYERDEASLQYRHQTKKISFYVIAFNKKTGKPIRTPK